MKFCVKMLLTGLGAFGAGFAAGYFVRKKTTEIEIEEITEEELEELTKGLDGEGSKEQEDESDDIFVSTVNPEVHLEQEEKEAYFRQWKEKTSDYDTRSKDIPENVVTEDVEGIEEYLDHLEGISPGTMADWMRCMEAPDGEYDTVELLWYDHDNVVTDTEGEPLIDSEKFMGFDVKDEFYLIDPDTTGDPDVRIIFNHKTKSVFHITRVSSTSYAEMKRMEEFGEDGYEDE